MRLRLPLPIPIVLVLAGILPAQEKYTARMMTRSGPNSEPVVKLQILIDSYTTGQEAWRLQQILEFSGYDPFISAFREANKGSISFYGTRGLKINIHVAEVIPTEKGRKILLFAERQTWDVDVLQRMDGRFPYMAVELNVDNRGKGDGKLYENAQIRFNGDKAAGTSTLELESYNSAPKVLFGVQLVK